MTIETIHLRVCQHLGISREKINSRDRTQPLAFYRQVGMFLCWRAAVPQSSLRSIARLFNRDHATAFHAIRSIKNDIKVYEDRRKVIEEIAEATLNPEGQEGVEVPLELVGVRLVRGGVCVVASAGAQQGIRYSESTTGDIGNL